MPFPKLMVLSIQQVIKPDLPVSSIRLKQVSEALSRGDIDNQQIPDPLRTDFLEYLLGNEELIQLLERLEEVRHSLAEHNVPDAWLWELHDRRNCHDVRATLKRVELFMERAGQLAYVGGDEHLQNLGANALEALDILRKGCLQYKRVLLLLELTGIRAAFYRAVGGFVTSNY